MHGALSRAGDAHPFARTVALTERAVQDKVFPGAAWGVLSNGAVAGVHASGGFTFAADSPRVSVETSFDLASVTKVMATTAMAMLLWQRERLDLDEPLGDLLPGFVIGTALADRSSRLRVTLRHLLAHSSGLPAYAPFYESCRTPAEVFAAALRLPLAAQPGSAAVYSDPGFILLGKALEVRAGEPLDRFCGREIFAPLGISDTRFRPTPGEWARIPPSEEQRGSRPGTVQGEVHDENCAMLGGVSGHAGLFAPVPDVLRFAEAMLAPLRPSSAGGLFSGETVRLFTSRTGVPAHSSRALGWDTPSGAPSSSGRFFTSGAFGHLGYTGTSLWIDPKQDLAVVLLTNRTFPTRENKEIQDFRPRFHDSILRELGTDPGMLQGTEQL